MGILVINAGSSSLKLSLFAGGQKECRNIDGSAREDLPDLIKAFCSESAASLGAEAAKIEAVGHRVVHGGAKYAKSTLITDAVINDLKGYIELDPSHEAANIKAIEQARQAVPEATHLAVFDTTYHHDMPLASQVYPGPYSWFADLGIRRYGFHGINHQYCVERVVDLTAGAPTARIITCHLGSGGSLCASLNGHSVMTTMGYTPLEGLVMRTRSGSIDPGIILVLLSHGYSGDRLNHLLNEESGLKGISGLSGDMREIEKEKAAQMETPGTGNPRAVLAFDIYEQSLATGIAGLVPTLGGLDALVFSGGIGEHSALVRSTVCSRLAFLGVDIDETNNKAEGNERDISAAATKVKTFVIAAGEDLAIARECARFCPAITAP
jgi:acetate kinase